MHVLLSSSILETDYHIFHCERYKTLSSTSDFLREQIALHPHNLPEGTVVIAENQTKGHGRYGREWISPEGNLNMSFLLHTHLFDKEAVPQLSFVLALAVGNALSVIDHGLQPEYKWPNDVLIKGRKIAGLLLESSQPDEMVVLSVGVNILSHPRERGDMVFPATSIMHETQKIVSREVLSEEILKQFSQLMHEWQQFGFGPIRNQWLKRAVGVGKSIDFSIGDNVFRGIFEDISETGELVLHEIDGNQVRYLSTGEVFFPYNEPIAS